MNTFFVAMCLFVASAGCIDVAQTPEGADTAVPEGSLSESVPGATDVPMEAAWEGRERLPLIDHRTSGWEFDAVCTFGGGPELDRGPERILPGASRIEITITASPTHTGIQIGWSIDDGDVRWTPTVARGTETHDAPVRPEDTETDAHRWRFFHQMNVKEAEQDCYTGGGAGESRILLEAVRG